MLFVYPLWLRQEGHTSRSDWYVLPSSFVLQLSTENIETKRLKEMLAAMIEQQAVLKEELKAKEQSETKQKLARAEHELKLTMRQTEIKYAPPACPPARLHACPPARLHVCTSAPQPQ